MLDIKLKLAPGHAGRRSWMEPSPLKRLCWNVTYACNAACGVCFTDAHAKHDDELTTEEARHMIRDARAAGIEDIIISGGEPFVREDLLELLACMAELGITARIASNGSLITRDILARLRRETLTKSFQISLDTLDPELYGAFHGCPPSRLETALEALRGIQDEGFHATVSVRVVPDTLEGIPELLDRAAAEGWATVTLHLPVHTRRAKNAWPQDADVMARLGPVFEHFLALDKHWLAETYIPWAEYHPVIREFEDRIQFVHRGCRAGRDRLTVNPTGGISPCVCFDVEEACMGNTRQDRLADVFENADLCRMLRAPWDHGICEGCAHVRTCGGGCRTAAYAMTGRLDGQDKCCPVWKARSVTAEP